MLHRLRQLAAPITPKALGAIGPDYGYDEFYACHAGVARHSGAEIPYVCEVWASCERPEKRGNGSVSIHSLLLNRTPSVAELYGNSGPDNLQIRGCGILRSIRGVKTADYCVGISIITPYVERRVGRQSASAAPVRRGHHHRSEKGVHGRVACDGEAAWRHVD